MKPDINSIENSVEPDQLASLLMKKPADQDPQSTLFSPQHVVWLVVLLLYVPSQQLWSLRDGQFT